MTVMFVHNNFKNKLAIVAFLWHDFSLKIPRHSLTNIIFPGVLEKLSSWQINEEVTHEKLFY